MYRGQRCALSLLIRRSILTLTVKCDPLVALRAALWTSKQVAAATLPKTSHNDIDVVNSGNTRIERMIKGCAIEECETLF